MSKFIFNIKKHIFRFIGDIKWSGLFKPFWFTINASGYQLKGEDYRNISKKIKPGDIVVRRFEGYVDKWLIPGFFNHAGIYVGGQKQQVVHAVSDGVIKEDILNFMRTDHMVILRPPKNMAKAVVKVAKMAVGRQYDWDFNFQDNRRFSCTELVEHCFPNGFIDGKVRFFRYTVTADDIVKNKKLSVVWVSEGEGKKWKNILRKKL
jgi:hypothetical protein